MALGDLIEFRDSNGISTTRPARYVITDMHTGASFQAADSIHGAKIMERVLGRHVSQAAFFCLPKKGVRAGALRTRFKLVRLQGTNE